MTTISISSTPAARLSQAAQLIGEGYELIADAMRDTLPTLPPDHPDRDRLYRAESAALDASIAVRTLLGIHDGDED